MLVCLCCWLCSLKRKKGSIKFGISDISNLKTDSLTQRLSHPVFQRVSLATIPDEIFGTKWSNPVKLDKKGKFSIFFCVFLTAIRKV